MGKLIVIEGLDGSGKATQAKLLFDELIKRGANVREVSVPDYDSASSALVKLYLAGEFLSGRIRVFWSGGEKFYSGEKKKICIRAGTHLL